MNSSPVKSKAFIRMCSDFANIVINPGNLYLIEGKVSFIACLVASPLEVRWESMKALCLVSEICLLFFVLLPFHQILSLK